VVDDPGLGYLSAPNITTGKGGLLSRHKTYSNEDYILAIKHGTGKDKKSLKLMPSYEYNPLSQLDLGSGRMAKEWILSSCPGPWPKISPRQRSGR
jgi:hypothetical protein